ncbi:MAG TPA: ERF family protein [Naasia sp.]|jgi:hypothetical protein
MADTHTPKDAPEEGRSGLAEALAAFQAELPSVKKGSEAKIPGREGKAGYSYTYADLTDISEAALPLLGKHGLAWTTKPTVAFGEQFSFVLEYRLLHGATGEAIEGMYPLPNPMNTAPQALGSAITYARRYCLVAVTGVAPGGDDDDASSAVAPGHASASQQRRTAAAQEPSVQGPPPLPAPTQDWVGQARKARTLDELRAVYMAADGAQELGCGVDGIAVGHHLRSIKARMEEGQKGTAVAAQWEGKARAAASRAELREVLEGAHAAGADAALLQRLAVYEDSLPPEAPSVPEDPSDDNVAGENTPVALSSEGPVA